MKFLLSVLVFLFAAAPSLAGEKYRVPADTKAVYEVLSVETRADGLKEIITKRTSPMWGDSFSKRLVDCDAKLAKYLGDGDTLDEMNASKPSPKMRPLVAGSSTHSAYLQACK